MPDWCNSKNSSKPTNQQTSKPANQQTSIKRRPEQAPLKSLRAVALNSTGGQKNYPGSTACQVAQPDKIVVHKLPDFLTDQALLEPITQTHANFLVQTLPGGGQCAGHHIDSAQAQDAVKTATAALRQNMRSAQVSAECRDRMVSVTREEGSEN